jgi:Flp pilus assembly protein TadD
MLGDTQLRTHLSRSFAVVVVLFMMLPLSGQLRGKGRLQGTVVDKASGKPISGATVTVSSETVSKPIVTRTNGKGQWSALGMTSGTWQIDIEADGYQPKRISLPVTEMQTVPPIRSELEAEVVVANVPADVAETVTEAQELLLLLEGDPVPGGAPGATITAENVKENSRKAAALLEAVLPRIPTGNEERKRMRIEIQQLLAQAQHNAGDVAKTIETLRTLVAADETNHANALLLVTMYLEDAKLAEAKALLEKLPAGAVSDPVVFLNVGISFLNQDSFADATVYFDKAIALDGNNSLGYYYRGLALLQLEKKAEAKADLEKVIALAPDGPEAGEARQLLAGLK